MYDDPCKGLYFTVCIFNDKTSLKCQPETFFLFFFDKLKFHQEFHKSSKIVFFFDICTFKINKCYRLKISFI